jgi:hypothetical protein
MSGGRFRGRYRHRIQLGLPVRTPWRFNRTINAHNETFHSNTIPGGLNSNVVALHLTFGTPMVFIPPSNNYGHEVGPYIWCSNTTHTNAFHVTYHGIGNGTNCLQFTHNALNHTTNSGFIGGAGGIRIANQAHTVIQTIDVWGNQWLLMPLNQTTPGTINIHSIIDSTTETSIRDTSIPDTRRNFRRRIGKARGGRRGGRLSGGVAAVANTDANTGSWTIYYANTGIDGWKLGPNVAFTPSGRKVIHEWAQGDKSLPDQSDLDIWYNYPQSEPHGFFWIANGVGQMGMANILSSSTPDANNMQLYVYLCNSSFNPTTNSSGIESCGGGLNSIEHYREEFSNTTGNWVTSSSLQATVTPTTYTLHVGPPTVAPTNLARIQHSLANAHLTQFNGNTYQFVTMRIRAKEGLTRGDTMGASYSWYGFLSWEYMDYPYSDTQLGNYGGNTHAWLTRNGTIDGATPLPNPLQTSIAHRDYSWRPLERPRDPRNSKIRRRGGRRGGRNWQGYVDLTWDMRNVQEWAVNDRVINAISFWTYRQNDINYHIDSIRIWGTTEEDGGGFLGPNNCSWVGADAETRKGEWTQETYVWESNGIFGATGASPTYYSGLTANSYLTGNNYDHETSQYEITDIPPDF